MILQPFETGNGVADEKKDRNPDFYFDCDCCRNLWRHVYKKPAGKENAGTETAGGTGKYNKAAGKYQRT